MEATIGLDTNIILRLFDRTNPRQSDAVDRLLAREKSAGRFLINPVVLAEFVWTLRRSYKKKPEVIADHVERLLFAPEFVIPFHAAAVNALRRYRKGPAGFTDYFFAEINLSLGCSSTLTFDANASAANDLFRRLEI